jgi:hypothetical protein
MSGRGDLRNKLGHGSAEQREKRCTASGTQATHAALASRLSSFDLDKNSLTPHERAQVHPLGRDKVRLPGVR